MTYSLNPAPAHHQMHDRPDDTPSLGAPGTFRIKRIGARPLAFRGSELAMAMSFTPEIPYWYEINLYRSDDQRFAAAVRLFFQSENERDVVRAWMVDSLDDALDAIESYDAGQDVRTTLDHIDEHMPPAEMASKALELAARVEAARIHYAGLVGELFDQIEAAAEAA